MTNPFAIPLDHITRVSTAPPQTSWRDLRAPGTALPGVIRAGTYYTPRGKEFWYATKTGGYLTLELKQSPYQRIILTISQNEAWSEQILEQVQRVFEAD
ncbi:hypothetical protein [Nodosilinea nodulosa]|uniref:hypothetical protein n=1 Tax=Nodosilinea nodulosa TaxID=416001 RepID=UPI000300167C|nr:hypothetical protein [Nodosilinea nodulosa]